MGHEFRLDQQIEIEATPEQVWAAIATGPGVDSWFMGRSEIEPGEGGSTRLTMLGQIETATITAWQPGERFAHRGPAGPDGTFMALEYLIEARAGASTVLRIVQSGVLGDNWDAEYEAMQAGWPMYLETLVAYLTHFADRTATPVTAILPGAGDGSHVFAELCRQFGLSAPAAVGQPARLETGPMETAQLAVRGVVDCASEPHYLGVRTPDALYRFIHSGSERGNAVVIGHHIFADIDRAATEQAWQSWLTHVFVA
jgi:uncharacterized protein YndB with AHSA1/START domain